MAGMAPADVFELTGVADPRLHPDGKTVAYVVWHIDREDNEYRSAIWLAASDGSASPRQLTSGEKRDSAPRWSSDGTRLAFASSRGEGKSSQLYVLPFAGGEATKLTDLKEDVVEVAWSPDGARLAFSSRVRDEAYDEEDDKLRRPRRFARLHYKLDNVGWTGDRRQHLFVVPADGSGEPTQLTSGDFEHSSPAWSPDGSQLAFVSARAEDWDVKLVSHIYVVAAAGGEPRQVTDMDGGWEGLVWSPDGGEIAGLFTPGAFDWPRHGRVTVVDAVSGEARVLTERLDRNCTPFPALRAPIWDDGRIAFAVEDGGNIHVYAVATDGSGEPELLVGGERLVTGYDVAKDVVVHSASQATTLSELFAGERQLTEVGDGFLAGRVLAAPEAFTAVSADGTEVSSWIIRPAGFEVGKRYPTLLSIHGGPYAQYHNGFLDEFQVYAGAGYAVVYCNPRGSAGYSEEWGRAIRGPSDGQGPGWGTRDYEDVIAAVDAALERYDFVDPDRLGVLGGSYGGFMTTWIVGHTDRFRAACSERAVNNMLSAHGSSDLFWAFAGQFGSFAFDEPNVWLDRSPATYARQITTPLLIMHSEDDLRCSVEQAEHLFVTMRLLGKEVEFVRFPAESHELSRSGSPPHRVMRFEIILDWFDRHLKA